RGPQGPAGGARFAAGGCPAAGRAAGPGEAGRKPGRAPEKRAHASTPAAAGAGGRPRSARGNRADSGRRLLHGSPPQSQKTRHALMCRLKLRPKLSNVQLRPKLFHLSSEVTFSIPPKSIKSFNGCRIRL
ncbi:hypothetical protein AAXB25_31435, partial [Paenibacillus lautus]